MIPLNHSFFKEKLLKIISGSSYFKLLSLNLCYSRDGFTKPGLKYSARLKPRFSVLHTWTDPGGFSNPRSRNLSPTIFIK